MEYGYYHPEHGYWQTITKPTKEFLNSYPSGTINVPLKPGPGYEYDGVRWVPPSKQWIEDDAAEAIRLQRKRKLVVEVDKVASNALRWASLTEEQQAAMAEYRQALLDITDQPGFPLDVVWPEKPEV